MTRPSTGGGTLDVVVVPVVIVVLGDVVVDDELVDGARDDLEGGRSVVSVTSPLPVHAVPAITIADTTDVSRLLFIEDS